jgi:signal transduction histidine kinase/DNA-binding response OmpR family regulator
MAKILIVDDNEQNLYMLQFLLQRNGYQIVTARNGQEALEKARAERPDVLITDILMPVMDGFSLCRQWQADDELQEVPFIFYTATYTDPQDEALALSLGADRFIVKPVEPDVFVEMLEEVIREAEGGRIVPRGPVEEETVYLREYNEALVRKLERKIVQLEEANRALEAEVSERKRAEQGLRTYARRLRALHEIDQAVLTARSPQETAGVALSRIRQLVPCAGAGIALFDAEAQEAVVLAMRADDEVDLEEGTRIPLEEVVDIESLRQGNVIAEEDLLALPEPPPTLQAAGLRSYVAVPLVAEGRLIGALGLGFMRPGAFSSEHVDIVREVAAQVAVALRQARLSAQLATERRRLETTVEHIPAGILLLDAERRILAANPAARNHLPLLADASPGDVLEGLADRPLEDLLASSPAGLWHELEIPGPPHRIFQVVARPVADEESPSEGWVLTVRDVTEERKVQERIRQQERLAAVGRLAGGIAHDFNNFLGTIMLYGNMILYEAELSSELASAAETIIAECSRASDLVGQILDFSRRSAMEVQSVDLVSFLDEVFDILHNTLPENICLITEIAPESCPVRADPTRVQQVMMNLAINARDAMEEGGDLSIAVSRVTLAPDEDAPVTGMGPGEWACVTVSDTGTGMSEEVKERMFEPFFTTKKRGEGTGLGLPQVYGIVTHHGGFIDVETEPGVGTTFYVYLPVQDAEPAEEVEETVSPAPGRGEVVLLVEDHDGLRRAGQHTLETLGYRALTAANGREAVEMLDEAAVDLVITDLVMPEMGGEALMRALSETHPDLPVLAVTGHRLRRGLQELKATGFDEVLLKPLDPIILAQAMRRALAEA